MKSASDVCLRGLSLLTFLLASSILGAAAQDTPNLNELQSIIGKPIDRLETTRLFDRFKIVMISDSDITEKHGPQYQWVSHRRIRIYSRSALPLWIRSIILYHDGVKSAEKTAPKEIVESVTFFVEGVSTVRYDGKLPCGLTGQESADAILDKFGRPEGMSIDQSGNGRITYQCGIPSVVPVDVYFVNHKLARITLYEDHSRKND